MTKPAPKKAPPPPRPAAKAPAQSAAPAKGAAKLPPKPAPAKAGSKPPLPAKAGTKPPLPVAPAKGGTKPPLPEPDPKAKALMLNARKRKSTPAIFKIRSRKNTPIVFTLDDVREIIKNRRPDKSRPEGAPMPARPVVVAAPPPAPKPKSKSPFKPVKHRVLGAASLADILGLSAPPRTQKALSLTQIMDNENIPQKWRKYYKQLVDLREHIRSGLDLHTSETLKRSAKEDSGDLSSYSQHMADAGTDTFDRDFALSLVSSEQELLYEIEEALKRIRGGSYGVCEITSQPIAHERLAAVPFTRYSLAGQKELEKQKRFGGNRGAAVGLFGEATNEDAAAMADDDGET